jgi:two-component system, cell cycle sensor histidine kinase and response regulator CckA
MPPLERAIAILHVEDSPADAKLIAAALRADRVLCEITVVDRQGAFVDALNGGTFDIILSDHSLPGFDGMQALKLAHALRPELPFISVSGAFGEEAAVEILRAGATDYVLKHRLSRLGTAVRRAMSEAEERARRARAEAEVQSLGEQLRHSQRLEAIGRTTGGVAHDFNNLLTVINGYSEQLLRKLPPDHELVPLVTPIFSAGQRGSDLTRRLLAFSRHQVLAPQTLSPNQILNDLRPMLKPLLGEQIELIVQMDPDLGLVHVDPGQIEQVIMNLATNARDAMPGGGVVTIETRNAVVDEQRGTLPAGPFVVLSVRDTGQGIDEEIQTMIFEPFFTTKERGHGTGLGLPTAYGIVAQSGGEIRVDSAPGRGTAMHVWLPRVVAAPPETPAAAPVETSATAGTETLLLVEDDDNVRELVTDFLEGAGYRVLVARDAVEAEARCEAAGGRIDLLVSDVVLPGLDGPSLAERLRETMPGLRTIFMSGYPGEAVVRPSTDTMFLAKPFSRSVLLAKVREALRGAG